MAGQQRILDAARYGRGKQRLQAWALLLLPVGVLVAALVVWALATIL